MNVRLNADIEVDEEAEVNADDYANIIYSALSKAGVPVITVTIIEVFNE